MSIRKLGLKITKAQRKLKLVREIQKALQTGNVPEDMPIDIHGLTDHERNVLQVYCENNEERLTRRLDILDRKLSWVMFSSGALGAS